MSLAPFMPQPCLPCLRLASRSLAHHLAMAAAMPWPHPMARASRHRAPRQSSGSPALPWDGLAPRSRSAPSSKSRRRVRTRNRFGLGAAVTLEFVQRPPKAKSGRSELSANHTTSFFFFGFGSGAYSAKLLAGTRYRFSGFSQPRRCGDDVLRMLVTRGPPVRGGGGMPHRISACRRKCSKASPPARIISASRS